MSFKADPSFMSCQGGYISWYHRRGSNLNLLVGTTVGSLNEYDNFADEKDNYEQPPPTTMRLYALQCDTSAYAHAPRRALGPASARPNPRRRTLAG